MRHALTILLATAAVAIDGRSGGDAKCRLARERSCGGYLFFQRYWNWSFVVGNDGQSNLLHRGGRAQCVPRLFRMVGPREADREPTHFRWGDFGTQRIRERSMKCKG